MVKYVDFINVMTYDYYAAWNGPQGCITGPPAQLYGGANANTLSQNVNTTMNYYACVTLQVQKINLGIPFYGDAVFHPTGLVPYIYYNTSTLTPINGVNGRFLGFENPASIGYKGDYAKNFNIGGLMVWNIDQDDSSFQMIVAVAQKASQLSVDNAIKYNCVLPG
uniref:GH18 domain-containing protein n=1 Tax=Acrobeloides nanus TaxID=290746 RepID=A0A914BXL7_9BILA